MQWIPEGHLGAGNLIVFDNGTEKDRAWSVVKEWWAPRDAEGNYVLEEGNRFGPAEPDWSYQAANPTEFFLQLHLGRIGSALTNGNTLVCAGKQGWVFEVTPSGDLVWDWRNPYGLDPEVDEPSDDDSDIPSTALFRAERYAPDHPGIAALREKGAPNPPRPGFGPGHQPARGSPGNRGFRVAQRATAARARTRPRPSPRAERAEDLVEGQDLAGGEGHAMAPDQQRGRRSDQRRPRRGCARFPAARSVVQEPVSTIQMFDSTRWAP